MIHQELQGWNVAVERIKIQEHADNGQPQDAEGWVLVFTEAIPPTKGTVRFAFGKDVRDYMVRELTGGVVLHGGELPRL